MSEKLSACNSCAVSPLRSNTLVARTANFNKPTSKRIVVKRTSEKMVEEKKIDVKSSHEGFRDEFGSNALNFTLVGSPAPRSQVRALVSSTSVAPKPKGKPAYSSKSREQNQHEICMEKLYQFADNPTQFVRSESHDEPRLKLDLDFSDRSEESENFYNSHNIAFGENGEYRIPEYDHIRFLQFSIGENQDPRATGAEDDSASIKLDSSPATFADSMKTAVNSEGEQNTISHEAETPGSQPADGSLNLSEEAPQIGKIDPWNLNPSNTSYWSNALPGFDNVPNYPLGSAINYKNNINPEVEKFMLDTGETTEENFIKRMQNNRLLDESILSKNFAQAVRVQSFEGSVENSSRTSPSTSRTSLSQASSGDGTWHRHSLNSPYFASMESNSWTDSKKIVNIDKKGSSKMATADYEETDEYLTIVKNEHDSALISENGEVPKYIFITNQYPGPESHRSTSASTSSRRDADELDKSSTRSSVTESEDNCSLMKMDRLPSAEIRRRDEDAAKDIFSDGSFSDYCIGNIFPSSASSSSSSSTKKVQAVKTLSSSTSLHIQNEQKTVETVEFSSSEASRLDLSKKSPNRNVLYMTLDEVNLAADYTSKLSKIFNRVLERSKSEDHVKIETKTNVNRPNPAGLKSQNTFTLIDTCLGSPNFCASHRSS